MEEAADRLGKLKWLCRRGMKELDVLLERFIELNQQQLEQGEWPEMESLLQNEDDVLWDWLQQPQNDDASAYLQLLTQMRHGA